MHRFSQNTPWLLLLYAPLFIFINRGIKSLTLVSQSKNTAKCKPNIWLQDFRLMLRGKLWLNVLGAFSTDLGCIFIKRSYNIMNVIVMFLCCQFIMLRIHCNREVYSEACQTSNIEFLLNMVSSLNTIDYFREKVHLTFWIRFSRWKHFLTNSLKSLSVYTKQKHKNMFPYVFKVDESWWAECGVNQNFSNEKNLLKNILRKDKYWHRQLKKAFENGFSAYKNQNLFITLH